MCPDYWAVLVQAAAISPAGFQSHRVEALRSYIIHHTVFGTGRRMHKPFRYWGIDNQFVLPAQTLPELQLPQGQMESSYQTVLVPST